MTECIFGWGKQHATMRKTKHRGLARVATDFLLNLIAYNLIRIPTLLAAWLGVSSQQHPSEIQRLKDGECANLEVLQQTARSFGRLPLLLRWSCAPPSKMFFRSQ